MDPTPTAPLPAETDAGPNPQPESGAPKPTTTTTTSAIAAPAATEPRRKVVRRRKKKTKEGPKYPQSGYIRFMHVRREELRLLQPDATTIDITKMIGAEWNVLAEDIKQPYLAAAKIDFERYNAECVDYKKTLSDRAAAESDAELATVSAKKEPKPKEPKSAVVPKTEPPTKPPSPSIPAAVPQQPLVAAVSTTETATPAAPTVPQPPKTEPRTGSYDIPIFTEDFLDHNKVVDFELRMLRKSNTDYELQNSVLERHVENMSNGVDKLRSEGAEMERTNDALQAYLDGLQAKLVAALGAPIPGHADGATMANLGEYMAGLVALSASSSSGHGGSGALNKARDVLRKLDV